MVTNLTGNEAVSYNAGGLTLGDNVCPLTVGDQQTGDFYNNYWAPYYPQWYPSYAYTLYTPSKIEQAFKVVGKLVENKVIKDLNVKTFMKLVTDIAEVL